MIVEGISLVQGVCASPCPSGIWIWIDGLTLPQPPGTGKTKTIIETIKLLNVDFFFFVAHFS
jgi:hypothetical protein